MPGCPKDLFIIMEEMRPELEKLQKQYANNKELYSQKMMALYKKEGYSAGVADGEY